MVSTDHDLRKVSVYDRAVHHLLELREAIYLAPEGKIEQAQKAFDRYLIRSLSQAITGADDYRPSNEHESLSDPEALADAIASCSSDFFLNRFNTHLRFNYERSPNGDIKTDWGGKPKIISESPPLEPHELEREIYQLYSQGEEYIAQLARLKAEESKAVTGYLTDLMSSMSEVREITQEPPEWFVEAHNDSATDVQTAWDKMLLRLVNHPHEMHPISSLEQYKQQRLAKDEHDSANCKHAYGLFLPWDINPICATYSFASPFAEQGQYVDNINHIVNSFGHSKEQERLYIYSTVGFNDLMASDAPALTLYENIYKRFLERFPEDETAERCVTVSPLTGFPAWLKDQLGEEGEIAFTATEDSNCKSLTSGVLAEEGVDAKTFLKHFLSFSDGDNGAAVRITSDKPDFSEFAAEKRAAVSALFDALVSDLATKYVFESWRDKKPYLHSDASIHLHAHNGARLVNLDMHHDGDEWARSAGVVANFSYLPEFPQLYGRMYEQMGWSNVSRGAQIAESLWDKYHEREEKLNPQLKVDGKSAQEEGLKPSIGAGREA